MRNRFGPAGRAIEDAAIKRVEQGKPAEQQGEKSNPMSRNMLNGAQVIVDYLIQEKVPQVFGLCGHGNIQFIDALYERSDDIKTISVHHESVAGFMADVYYRVSGRPTATFTSCGPGSANLPISLGNAFLDSVPFMAVTGNVPTSQFNRGAFQELYRHYQADFPPRCAPIARKCSSRRGARWCRSRFGKPGRR
jgi:acetolactate synthase I/II/III large subunit